MDRCGSWNSTVDVEKKKSKVVMPRYAILSKSNIPAIHKVQSTNTSCNQSFRQGRKKSSYAKMFWLIVTSTGQQLYSWRPVDVTINQNILA